MPASPDGLGRMLAAADVVVVLTDHDAFDYGSIVKHSSRLIDTRLRTAGAGVEQL